MDYASSMLNSDAFKSYKPDPDIIWKSYFLYTALAAGCVLPWYALIAGVDYFQYRYPDTYIIRIIAVAYLGAWLLCFLVFTKFGRQYTSWTRISVGLTVSAFAILVIPVMDAGFIVGEHGTKLTFYVTIAVTVVAGTADAFSQGSLIGVASELPHRYMQAIVIGSGACGVLVFIVRVIARVVVIWAIDSIRYSAVVHFVVCAFLIIIFLSAFVYVHRMPVMGYYNSMGLGSFDTVRVLLQDSREVSPSMSSAAAIASIGSGRAASTKPLIIGPVLRRSGLLAVAVFLLSAVTLSVFPGLLAEDMYSTEFHNGWYPLIFIGTFVITDFLGRLLTALTLPERPSVLFGSVAARLLIIIPFFVLTLIGPKIFGTEIPVLVITGLLGLSNGFLFACLSIVVPKQVGSGEAETAGIVMGILSATGCVVGAGLSWVWIIAT